MRLPTGMILTFVFAGAAALTNRRVQASAGPESETLDSSPLALARAVRR